VGTKAEFEPAAYALRTNYYSRLTVDCEHFFDVLSTEAASIVKPQAFKNGAKRR
jgi:hypothetical protein